MNQSPIFDENAAAPVQTGARVSPSPGQGLSAAVITAHYSGDPAQHSISLQSAFCATESLAEMASRDLDAALQLLAERAQYITDASGAAIALRRGRHNDMFCRASSGSSAPELGAMLSMEYGLSGESVRTGEIQRCDDAQNDSRVNREACRRLGIASVIVMPIIAEDQVHGVFELFSGKAYAFDERDLSALQRLGAMVTLTLKFAMPEQPLLPLTELPVPINVSELVAATEEFSESKSPCRDDGSAFAPVANLKTTSLPSLSITNTEETMAELQPAAPLPKSQQPAPKNPLFWSAVTPERNTPPTEQVRAVPVPPVMRNLQKCQACGFPISQGRKLCIECEEKEWRGQRPR